MLPKPTPLLPRPEPATAISPSANVGMFCVWPGSDGSSGAWPSMSVVCDALAGGPGSGRRCNPAVTGAVMARGSGSSCAAPGSVFIVRFGCGNSSSGTGAAASPVFFSAMRSRIFLTSSGENVIEFDAGITSCGVAGIMRCGRVPGGGSLGESGCCRLCAGSNSCAM